MGRDEVPDRIRWGVELLDVDVDHDVLEVGCGLGVALGLVADRLADGTGTVVGLDRSATAIERSRRRLARHAAANRVRLQHADLAHLDAAERAFDRVLAVNVNTFWTGAAEHECRRLADVLRPDGRVILVFAGPGGEEGRDVGTTVAAHLAAHGFASEIRRHRSGSMVAIEARRHG